MPDKRKRRRQKNPRTDSSSRFQPERRPTLARRHVAQSAAARPVILSPPAQPADGTTRSARVVIALASTGSVHEQTLAGIQAMVRATRRAASIEMWWKNAAPASLCRNELVRRFLESDCGTHLLFIDTDIVPPAGGLDLLLETGAALACGPAPICLGHPDPDSPGGVRYELTTNVMHAADPSRRGRSPAPDDAATTYRSLPYGQMPQEPFECDVTGMSFCLIARDVLARMNPPWFSFVESPDGTTLGEDVYFFRKAAQLGCRVSIHPRAMCDHVKSVDLSRLELYMGAATPQPEWTAPTDAAPPRTMVLACTQRRWLSLRTAETLLRWQEGAEDRIGVRLFDGLPPPQALQRWLAEAGEKAGSWERVLLIGRDIIPDESLPARLGSIDAPLVVPLFRSIVGGELRYNFARQDPRTRQLTHPAGLSRFDLSFPADAQSVDMSCCLIHRGVLPHAAEALRRAAGDGCPTDAFGQHFVRLLRTATGREPVVAPVIVGHMADIGLLGLMQLRERLLASKAVLPEAEVCRASPALA
jgi:hypothetical protein